MRFYLKKEEIDNLKLQLPIKWCGTICSGHGFSCCKLHRKILWLSFIILGILIIWLIINLL